MGNYWAFVLYIWNEYKIVYRWYFNLKKEIQLIFIVILHPENLLFFCMYCMLFCRFFWILQVLFFPFHHVCFFFSCLSVVATSSSTILNRNYESRYSCLISNFRRKTSSLKYDVSCIFFCKWSFPGWSSLLLLVCWELNIRKDVIFCQIFFCIY